MKRFSFSTGALYPLPSADALTRIGGAGFRYAELMPQAFSDVSEHFGREALRAGVHVASIHYPLAMFSMLYNAHPAMAEDGRKFSRQLVAMGRQLSTEVLVIHPHNPVPPEQYELLERPVTETLHQLAELCADAGIRLVVENSPNGPGRTPDSLLSYINKTFGVAAGVIVDTTEAREAGLNPAAFIREARPEHLHLSDFGGEKKHLPPGEGEIDWAAVKEAAESYGYAGLYTIEPSWRHYTEDIGPRLQKAFRFATERL